jgi:hypothetical protein
MLSMVFEGLERVSSTMRFDGFAQDWMSVIRPVLGNRCTVILLLVVTIQAGRNWLSRNETVRYTETRWK